MKTYLPVMAKAISYNNYLLLTLKPYYLYDKNKKNYIICRHNAGCALQ